MKLWKFLKPYKVELVFGPFFKLIEAVVQLFIPLLMAALLKETATKKIIIIGSIALFLVVFSYFTTLLAQYLASKASQGVGTDLRNSIFIHLSNSSLESLANLDHDSMMVRLIQDTNQVQAAVANLIRLAIRAPFLVIGSIVMSFIISPKLALFFLLITPLLVLVIILVMKFTIPLFYKLQQKIDKIGKHSLETLKGIRVLKSCNSEEETKKEFLELNNDYQKEVFRINRINGLLNPLVQLVINVGLFLIIYFGSFEVTIGSLEAPDVYAFTTYLIQIQMALVVTINIGIIFSKGWASKKRIEELLSIKDSMKEGTINSLNGEPTLKITDLSFNYPTSPKPALSKINLTINYQDTVYIVGGTGSGKSTLATLLLRYYEPTSGTIELSNRPLADYTNKCLQDTISFVPQISSLLPGTIKSNLLLSKPDATDEELIAALKKAEAWSFLKSNPDPLLTPVSQNGNNFSGGQKQRLSLARAFIKVAKIMILDEPTASLDYLTERKIRKQLKLIKATKIIITSRIATITDAKIILVFHKGEIVASGTHSELLKSSKIYQEICESQEVGESL